MRQTEIEASPWAIAMEGQLSGLFDDTDFLEVHRRMSPFNLFEAVGAIRGELRHSNFLGYLLSPSRPHGLGARPLAAFLRRVLSRTPPLKRPIMTRFPPWSEGPLLSQQPPSKFLGGRGSDDIFASAPSGRGTTLDRDQARHIAATTIATSTPAD